MLSTETLIGGQDHLGMLSNEAAFLTSLYAAMPETAPIDDVFVCPVVPLPPEPVSSCQLTFFDDYERKSRSHSKKKHGSKRRKLSHSKSSNKSSSKSSSKSSRKSSRKSSSKSKSRSNSKYAVVGECTRPEIRSLLNEHNHQIRLGKLETRLNSRFDKISQ